MKKLITLILVLSAWNTFAQLELVKESNGDIFSNKAPFILSSGEKMFYSNNGDGSISLFKRDFSLYKTVKLPELFPEIVTDSMIIKFYGNLDPLYDINSAGSMIYFTNHFFNNDDKIEFIVRKSNMEQTIIVLLNEDGTEIQRFTSNYALQLYYFDNLYVIEKNFKVYPYIFKTKIYSIPGNLPCTSSCNQKPASISPIDPSKAVNKLSIEGFPNPTSEKITLAYTLPKGSSYGTIRLYSQTGTLVKEFKVSDQFDHLELPVADFAAGTYFYELQVDGNSSGGKKMLVVH
jgi:hypothetical protein